MRTLRDEDSDGAETESFEDVQAVSSSEKALKCLFQSGEQHWVPRSQIHDNSEVYEMGHTGTLVVRAWWAKQVGLV